MDMLITLTIAAAYVSLLLELTVWHVSSVASSRQIFSADPDVVGAYSTRYRPVFRYPASIKAILFGLPLIAVYTAFVYPIAELLFGPDVLGDHMFRADTRFRAAGVIAIVLGRTLSLSAVFHARRNKQVSENQSALHTSGIFRWSRNPNLVGMYLFTVGIWLAMPSMTMLACILVYILYMDFKVRMEEDFLLNKFGSDYAQYKRTTRRYF